MFEEIGSSGLFLCLIVLLLSLISLTLLVLLVHSGLLKSVREVGTGKPPLGKVVIAYKFEKGPYNEAGQIFTEAHIIAPDNKCVGIYYDDPKIVPSHDLRYVVGSILGSDTSEINSVMMDRFTEKGFKTMILPEVEFAVKTSFPHVTTLSILIGIHKAYPKLQEYIEERKLCAYPFLEFYDGKDIHFFAPLSKQDEFWASECQHKEHKDGRGDEINESSDMNTTLDTSQSLLNESMNETPRSSPDDTANVTSDHQPVQEVSVDAVAGLDKGGEEDSGNVNADGEDEDNSSSSSFEVLKNE